MGKSANMLSLRQVVLVCTILVMVTKAAPRPKDIHIHLHGLGKMADKDTAWADTETGSTTFESGTRRKVICWKLEIPKACRKKRSCRWNKGNLFTRVAPMCVSKKSRG